MGHFALSQLALNPSLTMGVNVHAHTASLGSIPPITAGNGNLLATPLPAPLASFTPTRMRNRASAAHHDPPPAQSETAPSDAEPYVPLV